MSTFEERLRARIESLISETMDDCASEIRKAVVPPAKCDHKKHGGGHKPWPGEGPGACWCGMRDCDVCPEVVAARREAPKEPGPYIVNTAGCGCEEHRQRNGEREVFVRACDWHKKWPLPTFHHPLPGGPGLRLSGRDDMFGSQVWLNFDETAFEQWFRKWFDRQVRMHGGMKPLLNRLR